MIAFFKKELEAKRIFGLDILRAFAILNVVFLHGNNILPSPFKGIIYYSFLVDGVSIFFVLSGFLIGGILIRNLESEKVSAKFLLNFWMRRWLRTLPAYLAVLLILLGIHYLFAADFDSIKVGRYFIFSQNLFIPPPMNFFPEAWSLSVEEWFYLLTPVLMILLLGLRIGKPKQVVMGIAIFVICAVTIFRLIRFNTITVSTVSDTWNLMYRGQVFTRLDSIMYGVLGAWISQYARDLWLKNTKRNFFVGLVLFYAIKFIFIFWLQLKGLFGSVFLFSFESIGTLLMLPFLSQWKTGSGKIYKTLTFVSLISYSMYLVNGSLVEHWIIRDFLHHKLVMNEKLKLFVEYGIFWSLTILFSLLLYRFVEKPFMRWRDRRWAAKGRTVAH